MSAKPCLIFVKHFCFYLLINSIFCSALYSVNSRFFYKKNLIEKKNAFCNFFTTDEYWCYIVKSSQIVVLKMTKEIYFIKHIQSSGVDILGVSCPSSDKLPLSKMIWCFYVLWTFSLTSNIILVHLPDLKKLAYMQTISYTKLLRTTTHLGMMNQHDLLLQVKCRAYSTEHKYSFKRNSNSTRFKIWYLKPWKIYLRQTFEFI